MNDTESKSPGADVNTAQYENDVPKIISKISAIVAILSLMVLPLGSCDGERFPAIKILNTSEVDGEIKAFLVIAALFGFILLFVPKLKQIAIFAIGGLTSLLITILIAKGNPLEML